MQLLNHSNGLAMSVLDFKHQKAALGQQEALIANYHHRILRVEFTMWHQSIAFFVRTTTFDSVGKEAKGGCQRICALTIQMTRLRVQNRCQKSLQYTQGRRRKNLDSGWQKPICEIDVNPFFWLWENGEVTLNSL